MKLPLQGIVELQPGCTLRIKGVLISAPVQLKSERIVDNKMMLVTNVTEITAFNMGPLNDMRINHTETMQGLLKEIAELKKTKLNLRGLDFHHHSGMASLIIVLTFVLIAVVLNIRNKYKMKRALVRINLDVPKPREETGSRL